MFNQTVAYHVHPVGIGLVAAVLWELTAGASVGRTTGGVSRMQHLAALRQMRHLRRCTLKKATSTDVHAAML
jgi:hypothetical protein